MYIWFHDRHGIDLGEAEEIRTADLITTLTEFLETFLVVSLTFGMLFWLADVPIYLATLFGGMALATAPAPSLSVVHDI